MARFIAYLDGPMWGLVRDLYYADKVEEAFQESERLGGQDSNDLYAEAEVRKLGEQFKIRPWLTVEAIVDQVREGLPAALEIIGAECEQLSRRFGWDNRESTLVAILPSEVEAQWMPGRWGYFVDKTPYDKICLPFHLVADPPELTRTIQHEFMHAITLNLCNGHDPHWLSEGMSTYAENRAIARSWREWRAGEIPWLDPEAVNTAIDGDSRIAEQRQTRARAYAQSNAVVRYLVSIGGEDKLARLLRAVGDESVLHNLENKVLGRSRTDGALRSLYGIGERELFERAEGWIRANDPP